MAPRHGRHAAAGSTPAANVTGPQSAMTSFLRSEGITAPGRNTQRAPPLPVAAGGVATVPVALVPALVGQTLEEEDEEVEEVQVVVPTNTSNAVASGSGTSTAVTKKRKAESAAATAASKKKKQAEAAAAVPDKPTAGRYDHRALGAIQKCGECGRKFTVTKVCLFLC